MLKGNLEKKLVVLTGPSAVGKDAVEAELIKLLPLKKVITTTTRPPRPGEKRDITRHYVTKARFKKMIKEGLLIEHNFFIGNYYGTQWKDMKKPILQGYVPLLDVDPNEAMNIRKRNPNALVIFLKPESLNVLKKRLVAREGTTVDEIAKRISLAKEAIKKENAFSYSVINKDGHLDETVKVVKKIIKNYLRL